MIFCDICCNIIHGTNVLETLFLQSYSITTVTSVVDCTRPVKS